MGEGRPGELNINCGPEKNGVLAAIGHKGHKEEDFLLGSLCSFAAIDTGNRGSRARSPRHVVGPRCRHRRRQVMRALVRS
jgi:hypothetical protein